MTKAISIGVAFILGVGAGWIVQGRHWDTFLTSYIPALATLLAAFYGAKYAFQFQNDKELNEIKRRNLEHVNSVIFDLMRMANALFVYKRDFINPIKNSPNYFIELRPSQPLEKLVHLKIEGLYFLLETEHRNLVGEIIAEEEKYRSAIDSINARSKFHLEEFQPALEKYVLSNHHTVDSIRALVGDRIYVSLKNSSDTIIDQVDDYTISIENIGNKLTQCIKQIYPNDVIISFKLPRE
ncbi:hypothetical protein [Methylotenera sp. N17]|uniref:hypothetical protein n=1 Tax=Methylotenera sp. N17 TaxID=1502761 RepID=UPI000646524E|nr:hypothetical protein [Methylotenera sp. N17]